ncbi:MAG: radical SAM protein [Planctomycetes bacterium]|nr:radical SAM protein [Planctomycetota bacterium]
MAREPAVWIVFPPYVHQMRRPYSAPAQLVGYLHRHGVESGSLDLNLRYALWLSRPGGPLELYEASLLGPYREIQSRGEAGLALDRGEVRLLRHTLGILPTCSPAAIVGELSEFLAPASRADLEARPPSPLRPWYGGFAQEHGICHDPDMGRLAEWAASDHQADPFGDYLSSAEGGAIVDRLARSDVVGLSLAFGQQLHPALVLAREVKRRNGRALVLLGGQQSSLLDPGSLATLVRSPHVDGAVRFDGEVPLREIAAGLGPDESWRLAPGLVQADSAGTVHVNPPPPPIPLDELEAPEYDAEDLELRRRLGPLNLRVTVAMGCYWGKCKFCDYPVSGNPGDRRHRVRSPARVVEDVKRLEERHRAFAFELTADSLPPGWVREFCERVIAEGVSASFAGYMRPEGAAVLTPGLFRLMRRAGFEWVGFGGETTSDRLLVLMNKGTTRREIAESIEAAAIAGIRPMTSWIPDLPSITREELSGLADFLREARDILAGLQIERLDIRPVSPILAQAAEFGLRLGEIVEGRRGFRSYRYVRSEGVAGEELERLCDEVAGLAARLRLYQATVENRERIAARGFSWAESSVAFSDSTIVSSRFSLLSGGARTDVVFVVAESLDDVLELPARCERTIDLLGTSRGVRVPFATFAERLGDDVRSLGRDVPRERIRRASARFLSDCVRTGFVSHVFGGACFEDLGRGGEAAGEEFDDAPLLPLGVVDRRARELAAVP